MVDNSLNHRKFQSKSYSRVVDAEIDASLQALWFLQEAADRASFSPQQRQSFVSEVSPSPAMNCQGKPSRDSLVSFRYQVNGLRDFPSTTAASGNISSSFSGRLNGVCHDVQMGVGWLPSVVEAAIMSLKPGEAYNVPIDNRFPLVARGFFELPIESSSPPILSIELLNYCSPKPPITLRSNRVPIFSPGLSKQRNLFVANVLRSAAPTTLIDLGCGEGKLLTSLVCAAEIESHVPSLQHIAGKIFGFLFKLSHTQLDLIVIFIRTCFALNIIFNRFRFANYPT